MRMRQPFIHAILALVLLHASFCIADELVLTSGERFTSSKIWEENGKIRFNMHGLVVSVNKSDVAAILRPDGTANSSNPLTDNRPQAHPPVPVANTKSLHQDPAVSHADTPLPEPSVQNRASDRVIGNKAKGIGIGGVSWNMRPTELPGLTKIETEAIYGGIDQYWQPDGPATYGRALLDGMVFGFWQNRLYSIMMWVDGRSGYRRLQDTVFERYGMGQKSKNRPERYFWAGDKTTDRLLEYDQERNIGIFWMRSRELDAYIKQRYPDAEHHDAKQ